MRPTHRQRHDVVHLGGSGLMALTTPGMQAEEARADLWPVTAVSTMPTRWSIGVLLLSGEAGVGGAIRFARDLWATWEPAGGGHDGHNRTKTNRFFPPLTVRSCVPPAGRPG